MQRMRIPSGVAVALALSVAAAAYGGVTTSRIPNGVYRATLSEVFMRYAGVSAADAAQNSGVQTLIFRGKRWTNKTVNRYHPPDCSGDLSYTGNRVTLVADRVPQCGTAGGRRLFSARWSFERGQLRFTAIQPKDVFSRTAWGGKPWTKIA